MKNQKETFKDSEYENMIGRQKGKLPCIILLGTHAYHIVPQKYEQYYICLTKNKN